MVYFLVKEDLPVRIANLKVGETLVISELPSKMRLKISWSTMWFNYTSAFVRGGLGLKFINSIIYSSVSTFAIVILGLMMSFALSKMQFKKISKAL